MNRALRSTALTVALLSTVAACSSGGSSDGSSSPSGMATAAASSSQSKAPTVSNPLPVDEIVADPCSGLSDTQLQQLGMAMQGRRSTNAGGPVCQWVGSPNDLNAAFFNVLTANKNGLSDIYDNNAAGKFAYFEPLKVIDYPAVYADSTDDRANGTCGVDVGLTDQLVVNVAVHLAEGPNVTKPCDSANKIATAMIEHLKGAA